MTSKPKNHISRKERRERRAIRVRSRLHPVALLHPVFIFLGNAPDVLFSVIHVGVATSTVEIAIGICIATASFTTVPAQ